MSRTPLIIGHRGASHDAPENTLASFLAAFAQGADGVEGDFRLTRDGEIVCMHDATTTRTAGVDLAIAESTLQELKTVDIGSWFGARYSGETIPTLAEVLDIIPDGKMIFIEIKSGSEIIHYLKKLLDDTTFSRKNIRLLAFDPVLARELVTTMPDIAVCLNLEYYRTAPDETWLPDRSQVLDMMTDSGAGGLSSEAHVCVDAALVDELHNNNRELFIWTIDSICEAQHYQGLGVDAIMTNRPGLLAADH